MAMQLDEHLSRAIARCKNDDALRELLRYVPDLIEAGHNPMSLYRFADACQRLGDLEGWRDAVHLAMLGTHATAQQQYYRARAKIRMGDWSGWTDFDARYWMVPSFQSAGARTLFWKHVMWDGQEDLDSRTVLAVAEQGYGDTLQMLRFIPELAAKAKHVVLAVQEPLVTLAEFNFSRLATVLPTTQCLASDFDCYVWLMSLPARIGYLPEFRRLLAPGLRQVSDRDSSQLHLGICWAGSSDYGKDKQRSIPIDTFHMLLDRNDVQWISLQIGDRAADANAYDQLHQLSPPPASFAETADLIAYLDGVISVDTAIAHLAGSLGVPTLLLLNAEAVWRWGLAAETPWYPSVRLIRQHIPGEWIDAIGQAGRHIDAWVSREHDCSQVFETYIRNHPLSAAG